MYNVLNKQTKIANTLSAFPQSVTKSLIKKLNFGISTAEFYKTECLLYLELFIKKNIINKK